MKWVVTHEGNGMQPGDVFEGKELPLWLVGKAKPQDEKSFEVATPEKSPPRDKKTK